MSHYVIMQVCRHVFAVTARLGESRKTTWPAKQGRSPVTTRTADCDWIREPETYFFNAELV